MEEMVINFFEKKGGAIHWEQVDILVRNGAFLFRPLEIGTCALLVSAL